MAKQENETDPSSGSGRKGKEEEEEEESEDDNQHSTRNALVIRDGFPALLMASHKTKKWWIDETDETMKLPRWPFWAHDDALDYPTKALPALVSDCHKVFTARARDDNAAYSAGTTYFLPAQMNPRCALEGLVQLIFQQHVKLLPSGNVQARPIRS
jgi:hypothetical protein